MQRTDIAPARAEAISHGFDAGNYGVEIVTLGYVDAWEEPE